MSYWIHVSKCDKAACNFARPHYSRAKPDSKELGPPGQKIVLMGSDNKALWGSHRPAPWAGVPRMDGFEGHSCFIFRNDGGPLSSLLIREAVAYTVKLWGIAAFITYVAIEKVNHKRDPGRCFIRAGFYPVGIRNKTKHGRMLRLEMSRIVVAECAAEYM